MRYDEHETIDKAREYADGICNGHEFGCACWDGAVSLYFAERFSPEYADHLEQIHFLRLVTAAGVA